MFCFANAASGRLTGVKLRPSHRLAKRSIVNQLAVQVNTSDYKRGASRGTRKGGGSGNECEVFQYICRKKKRIGMNDDILIFD